MSRTAVIGFNVARARKWPSDNWQGVVPYVLGNESFPLGFRVFVQLMIPTPVEKTDLPVTPGTTEVPPWPMSVYIEDVSSFPGLASGFWISVWSYRFFVVREDVQSRDIRRRGFTKWLKCRKGAHELTRRGSATVYASSVDVLDDAEDSAVFREQLSLARKLKFKRESKRSTRGNV